MTTFTIPTHFIPADLDGSQWSTLESYYRALIDREIGDADELEQLILDRSELDAAANEAHANLYIAMTCQTDDQDRKRAYLDFVENTAPKLKEVGFELDRKIVEHPFASRLNGKYDVMLRDLRADVEIFRPENIPLSTEDTKLGQQYDEINGAMTVEFRGEEKTLPQMGRHLEETDRATREEAWRLVAERRHQDADRMNDIFDRMVALRHEMATNAGFDNFRDYMFKAKHRFDYSPADCEAYHDAAEKVCVPLLRDLERQRATMLGVDPLRPWDLAVDVHGREPLRPFDGGEELEARTSELFGAMDNEFGAMFDTLRDGRSLDLVSRKGKAPGGYQETRDRERTPFIFMNASGMHRDLETMIHEAGHAFHSILSQHEPLLHYRHAPIEFAEVASMSMELLAQPYFSAFYDDAEAARAKRQALEDLPRLFAWTSTVDAFQHWIYTNVGHSREERRQCWEHLQERFGTSASWDGLEPYRAHSWHRQLHIFVVPFYYIEYGIAQLGAVQLWLQSLQDEQQAFENYRRAMRLGGSRPLPELFEAADLKFDFGAATMATLMTAVRAQLETLPA